MADLAEQARTGNRASVFNYLQGREHGFALPIRRVREHTGFTAGDLADMLGGSHPPQGHTLIDKDPRWSACATDCSPPP
ncbi:hypothetical protein [Actinoalloteichus spitiensis]|uniref:hypothetical protein n=1 Tax=Actinoalloteichus spitiensis TaxID=252394 RepID=UPI0002D5DB5D|nr:hypothetical protein [Actinoalloteichus spitiensis]